MSHAVDGSAQSIDCAGQLMDPSIVHHLIDALLEWVIIHSIHRLAAILSIHILSSIIHQ